MQAPRGTVASLKRYHEGWDVGGIDIYPISYPPGVHSLKPNKEISMVGDYTQMMRRSRGGKPFWMTLQIAFSGVVKPGRTLRFPTFPEQRYMAYQAIINGARGLVYFGGGMPQTFNERDKPLGYNWTYWNKVMRPLFEEVGTGSPIARALVAPDSKLKVTVKAVDPARPAGVEQGRGAGQERRLGGGRAGRGGTRRERHRIRRARSGDDVYVLACKREGPTMHVRFSGLPKECGAGTSCSRSRGLSRGPTAASPTGSGRSTCTSTSSAGSDPSG